VPRGYCEREGHARPDWGRWSGREGLGEVKAKLCDEVTSVAMVAVVMSWWLCSPFRDHSRRAAPWSKPARSSCSLSIILQDPRRSSSLFLCLRKADSFLHHTFFTAIRTFRTPCACSLAFLSSLFSYSLEMVSGLVPSKLPGRLTDISQC
jgi:hypothetical protein